MMCFGLGLVMGAVIGGGAVILYIMLRSHLDTHDLAFYYPPDGGATEQN